MQTRDEDMNEEEEELEENEQTMDFSPQESHSTKTEDEQQQQQQRQAAHNDINAIKEPAGWSMSLTANGLSIHTVTRNLNEYNEFAKVISRQIIRDFGPNYLPQLWDPDAEGYFEEDSDAEELDEDEYLVTVPVFSTSSLLFNQEKNLAIREEKTSKDVLRTLLSGTDTLISLIQSHFVHMIQHLNQRYSTLEKEADVSHHLVISMLQLKTYLPLQSDQLDIKDEPLIQICILTAYVTSITLLPPIPNVIFPPLTASLWRDCAEYATMLLIEFILKEGGGGDNRCNYPIILCTILLAWIDAELSIHDLKADTMVHIALRILCSSNWQKEEPAWQILIATLLYLDIYSSTFRFKRPQLCGEGIMKLWKAAIQIREPEKWNTTAFREIGIILEAKLMSLLNKVIMLFYKVDDENADIVVRKIDVDEVLTLVRDIELWEQELPDWAKWNMNSKEMVVMHMHLIHNIVKILLFRPFCYTNEEQTFTKSTFLDMSLSSADRLTYCLLNNIHSNEYWINTAIHLIKDVSNRVLNMFDKDEDIVNQLDKIKYRLENVQETIKGK